MKKLEDIFKNRNLIIDKSKRKINVRWEIAEEFGQYVDVPVKIVLRLFKKYGEAKVLATRSWLRDLQTKAGHKDKTGLLIWKLKNG